jgi:ABC-type uncharacterized transport system auxiliary subunit
MKKAFYISVVVLLLLGSCRSSKPVATRFYLIEFSQAEMHTADTLLPLPYSLEIIDVDVNPAFSSNQIAIREEAHEINYFVNHQWASRPQHSLERFVMSYFNNNNIFEHTEKRFWNIQPDFRLFISVYNLEVVRDRKDYLAHLHVEFRLESAKGEIILKHVSDTSRLLEKRNLNLFANAINHMFFEQLNFFSKKVHFILSPA